MTVGINRRCQFLQFVQFHCPKLRNRICLGILTVGKARDLFELIHHRFASFCHAFLPIGTHFVPIFDQSLNVFPIALHRRIVCIVFPPNLSFGFFVFARFLPIFKISLPKLENRTYKNGLLVSKSKVGRSTSKVPNRNR